MKKMLLCVASVFALVGMSRQLMAADNTAASYSTATITNQKLVYEPQVIVRAKWGDGPGEIGYRFEDIFDDATGKPLPDPKVMAPVYLAVGPGDVLYLIDGCHKRVLKYNSETGALIGSIDNIEIPRIEEMDNQALFDMHIDSVSTMYVGGSGFPFIIYQYVIVDGNGKILRKIADKKTIEESINIQKKEIDRIEAALNPAVSSGRPRFTNEEDLRKAKKNSEDFMHRLEALYADPLTAVINPGIMGYDDTGDVYLGNYRVTGGSIAVVSTETLKSKNIKSNRNNYLTLRKKIVPRIYTDEKSMEGRLHDFADDECTDSKGAIYKVMRAYQKSYMTDVKIIKWTAKQ